VEIETSNLVGRLSVATDSPLRAAIRRDGCDGGQPDIPGVCKSNVQNCKASHPPTTHASLASYRDRFTSRMHESAAETAGWNASPQQLERKQGVHVVKKIAKKFIL